VLYGKAGTVGARGSIPQPDRWGRQGTALSSGTLPSTGGALRKQDDAAGVAEGCVEHMSCIKRVHSVNVMMTRSCTVRSTHAHSSKFLPDCLSVDMGTSSPFLQSREH
jgi:hypothetical protein